MIIKKSDLETQKSKRGTWPFSVHAVTVFLVKINTDTDKPSAALAVVHNFGAYALSGILVQHGFEPLENAGIWKSDFRNPDAKRSLGPLFQHINKLLGVTA